MPLAVYIALEIGLEAAVALGLILLFISLAVLVALQDRWFPIGMSLEARSGSGWAGSGWRPSWPWGPASWWCCSAPTGPAKTTLLRALAGLLALERGRVVLDGVVLEDTEAGTWVPTEQRPVEFVFQDYLLFPHLSALENVAFGLRARGLARPRPAAGRRLAGAGRPGQPRRGQAPGPVGRPGPAGRAGPGFMVGEPRLLLLDRPLAALDAATRTEVRRDLRRHLASFDGTRLLVTHDPLEAIALADRLVVLEGGHVTQTGSPAESASAPLPVRGRAGRDQPLPGPRRRGRGRAGRQGPAGRRRRAPRRGVRRRPPPRGRPAPPATRGHPRNVLAGTADTLDVVGDQVRVRVAGPSRSSPRSPRPPPRAALADGGPVWASVKATEVTVYRLTEEPPLTPAARPPPRPDRARPIGHVRTAYRRMEDTPIQTSRNPGEPAAWSSSTGTRPPWTGWRGSTTPT